MATTLELLKQSLAALRDANRIDGSKASYRKDNPAEYQAVMAYLDGAVRPVGSLTLMGRGLVLIEDAIRDISVPPPPPPQPDTGGPSVPQGTLGTITDTSITLDWQASVDNVGVDHYNVFRGAAPASLAKIAETAGLSYVFAGLTVGTEYALALESEDAAGNKSPRASAIWFPVTTLGGITPPPPPPPTPGLMWSAPALGAYTEIEISDDTPTLLTLDSSKDYVLKSVGQVTRQSNNCQLFLRGGRHVIAQGLDFKIDTLLAPGQSSYRQRSLMLEGQTGIVHLEGFKADGAAVGQAITVAGKNVIVQLQNSFCRCLHPIRYAPHPTIGEVHTDVVQSWAGPSSFRIWNTTFHSQAYMLQMNPHQSGAAPMQPWHFERFNVRHLSTEGGMFNKGNGGQAWWQEFHKDFWADKHPNHGGPYFVNWSVNEAGWNPGGGTNVTGEAIKKGIPPAGDFWTPEKSGLNYVGN